MNCCGRRRELAGQAAAPETAETQLRWSAPVGRATVFEYVGATGLTATGPITGQRYRFNRPGEQLAVDARDAPALMAVPNLRRAAGAAPRR